MFKYVRIEYILIIFHKIIFFYRILNQNAVLVRYFSKTNKCMDPKHVTVHKHKALI